MHLSSFSSSSFPPLQALQEHELQLQLLTSSHAEAAQTLRYHLQVREGGRGGKGARSQPLYRQVEEEGGKAVPHLQRVPTAPYPMGAPTY